MFAILFIALCALCLWVGFQRGTRLAKPLVDDAAKKLTDACDQWNSILLKEQANLAAEERCTGYLSQERIADRHRLLDAADKSLNEAKRGSNIETRCEALGCVMVACTQHRMAFHSDMVKELLDAAAAATAANERGDRAFSVPALQKLQDLMIATKRELDSAKEQLDIPKREYGPAFMTAVAPSIGICGQSLQRAKIALPEATAIAKALGLPIKSPPLPA